MRINQYLARATGLSRRAADTAISAGQVKLNERLATLGDKVGDTDKVSFRGNLVKPAAAKVIMLHKPKGYVTSRRQQGSTPTIYKLLPDHFHSLKPVGRLDKDSSGLLLLTNDGELAQQLQHPSSGKVKQYVITVGRPLTELDIKKISDGIKLDDGMSKMKVISHKGAAVTLELEEGRNRQIRRSFEELNHRVVSLERDSFGEHTLGNLKSGTWREVAG